MREEVIGKRFGTKTVIRMFHTISSSGKRILVWEVRCDCGRIYAATPCSIKNTHACRSCTVSNFKGTIPHNFLDLTGKRFGRRLVLRFLETRINSCAERYSVWWTRCDCGKEKEASTGTLRAGKSCGCLSREISGESRRLPLGISARNACLGGYKACAYKREITWNISDRRFDELTSSDCHYCGIPPNQKSYSSRRESGVYVYNGIDRVDNSLGYEPDNVVSCCKVCNRAKDTMTVEEFLSWIERVHNMKSKTAEKTELLPNQKTKPQTVGVSGPGPFKGTRAGEKRAGSTKYQDYPGELGSNPAYKGGVGDCK